jgi:hypothetical protein
MLAVFFIGGWVVTLLLVMFLLALGILSFVFWIWMLIDCLKNERIYGNEKIAWVLVIALLHSLGALIYFFAGRNRRGQVVSQV